MTFPTSETAAHVRIDQIVREYKALGEEGSANTKRRARLREQILEWMGEDDSLELEGLPTLRLKEGGTELAWDSHAIQKMQVERPAEWERICELGAVKLDVKVLREAVANGQLMGLPPGYVEMKRGERLEFDR